MGAGGGYGQQGGGYGQQGGGYGQQGGGYPSFGGWGRGPRRYGQSGAPGAEQAAPPGGWNASNGGVPIGMTQVYDPANPGRGTIYGPPTPQQPSNKRAPTGGLVWGGGGNMGTGWAGLNPGLAAPTSPAPPVTGGPEPNPQLGAVGTDWASLNPPSATTPPQKGIYIDPLEATPPPGSAYPMPPNGPIERPGPPTFGINPPPGGLEGNTVPPEKVAPPMFGINPPQNGLWSGTPGDQEDPNQWATTGRQRMYPF